MRWCIAVLVPPMTRGASMPSKSFENKIFTVADPDARIRNEKNLLQFALFEAGDPLPPGKKIGDPKIIIPAGTKVMVTEVKIVNGVVFGLAVLAGDPATTLGWTSTR